MSRPTSYPTYHCPDCHHPLKRKKHIYYDCLACHGHFKLDDDGQLKEVAKRIYQMRKVVSDSSGKYLTADEYEALVS